MSRKEGVVITKLMILIKQLEDKFMLLVNIDEEIKHAMNEKLS